MQVCQSILLAQWLACNYARAMVLLRRLLYLDFGAAWIARNIGSLAKSFQQKKGHF